MANELAGFNPVQSFQTARHNAQLADKNKFEMQQALQNAPRKNALADITLRKAQSGEQVAGRDAGIATEMQKIQFMNQASKAIRSLPEDLQRRQQAFQTLTPLAQKLGIDTGQYTNVDLTNQNLEQMILSTDSFISNPEALTAQIKGRNDLEQRIKSSIDPNTGQLIPVEKMTPVQKAAAIEARLIPPAVGSAAQTIAADDEKTEQVATSQAKVRAAIKEAEVVGIARGESVTDLVRAEAALPGLTEVVGKLKVLSEDATFTLAGKGFNEVAKQFGLSTTGGTSRASMVSIVDNQILPLLRPIFGAAFTAAEGEKLRNALMDPDSTPESRKAQLDAFLEQMKRNIEAKKLELASRDKPSKDKDGPPAVIEVDF